ncbi:hypothetical protein ABM34_11960 [Companilactobacillus ginsenosidimutans]|uniref:Uncharacterized protein n=1 Tax=Companilactobacillus ginsenosidimutans TaxID=1007676 RepID=A0A0H4QN52_9LACO|nr:hypothetical protein ABM34_11960 [Companilactobacillus ginsenosidimutans]
MILHPVSFVTTMLDIDNLQKKRNEIKTQFHPKTQILNLTRNDDFELDILNCSTESNHCSNQPAGQVLGGPSRGVFLCLPRGKLRKKPSFEIFPNLEKLKIVFTATTAPKNLTGGRQ